jgi:DNA adenine methylase
MTTPLLRWAGSKRKLLPLLITHCPPKFGRYVEPFAGSACLFFALNPFSAVLGDFNVQLIDFYRFVAQRPDELAEEIATYPISKEFYYKLRSRQPSRASQLKSAARFLYLNRYCFNGVYRTNKIGRFNVPYGSRTGPLPSKDHLRAVSERLKKATLIAGDFISTLSTVRRGDFIYLDPPYSASRYRGEYGYGAFSLPDIERMSHAATELDRVGATFLISYKSDVAISRAFRHWHQRSVSVRRHISGFAGSRGSVEELLISNRRFSEVRD